MTADESAPIKQNGFTQMTLCSGATRHIDFRFMVPYAISSAALKPI